MRSAVFTATMTAVRFNSSIRALSQPLLEAGTMQIRALIACTRKPIVLLNAVIKNGADRNEAIDQKKPDYESQLLVRRMRPVRAHVQLFCS